MKVTDVGYHNIDWLVKTKNIDVSERKEKAIPGNENNKKLVESNLDIQKMKRGLAEKIGQKFKELAKKNYIVNISIHKKTKQFVIKIIDPQTKKIVREMPWEKFLDLVAYMIESIQKEHTDQQGQEKEKHEIKVK